MIWDFDPVAFAIFGLPVRWYGLAYIAGFLIAVLLGYKLQKKILTNPLTRAKWQDFVVNVLLVGILGGRLGEFLFFRPSVIWTDPVEILRVWNGGMSIHGGILFALIYILWWSRRKGIKFLQLTDSLSIPLALSLMVGRIANFINGELVGIPTGKDWGVIFPHVDQVLRHPSTLYEAGKNLIIASVLFLLFRNKKIRGHAGILTAGFLIGYGVLRFGVEFVRTSDGNLGPLSVAQWLSLIMLGIGTWMVFRRKAV